VGYYLNISVDRTEFFAFCSLASVSTCVNRVTWFESRPTLSAILTKVSVVFLKLNKILGLYIEIKHKRLLPNSFILTMHYHLPISFNAK
jgi:hypothetical protein